MGGRCLEAQCPVPFRFHFRNNLQSTAVPPEIFSKLSCICMTKRPCSPNFEVKDCVCIVVQFKFKINLILPLQMRMLAQSHTHTGLKYFIRITSGSVENPKDKVLPHSRTILLIIETQIDVTHSNERLSEEFTQ